jgi:hypothetical protein
VRLSLKLTKTHGSNAALKNRREHLGCPFQVTVWTVVEQD